MNNIDLMNYWIESSDEDYNVMKVLYKNNMMIIKRQKHLLLKK